MLIWWIDQFKYQPGDRIYRYHVIGHYEDMNHPAWEGNGQTFRWNVPDLRGGGGRYVFRLRPV